MALKADRGEDLRREKKHEKMDLFVTYDDIGVHYGRPGVCNTGDHF